MKNQNKKKDSVLPRIIAIIIMVLVFSIVKNANTTKPIVDNSEPTLQHNSNYEGKEVDDEGNYIGAQESKPNKKPSVVDEDKKQEQTEEKPTDVKPVGKDMVVHYLNIGQGDAIFIELNDKTMLIDGGNPGDGPGIEKYIRARGHSKIDMMMGSHPHADHIGGLPYLVENMEVGEIYLPRTETKHTPTTKIYESLLVNIKNKGLKIKSPGVGDVIYDEGPAKITVVNSRTNAHNLNDYSIATKLDYGDTSYMFAGDLEAGGEKDLLNEFKHSLDVDVYKSNHHGSNTSSTHEFLKAMSPDDVVIQVGQGNRYGHPHKEVIVRYNMFNMNIYRNDLDGTVISVSDGNKQTIYKDVTPADTTLKKWDGKINFPQ